MAGRSSLLAVAAIACAVNWAPGAAAFASIHESVGVCMQTTVVAVGPRASDTGSVIEYANGRRQVDYNHIPAIHRSRSGDPMLLCLTEIPVGCPPGDDRGRTYKGTNLRTRGAWSVIDSEHSCGGD